MNIVEVIRKVFTFLVNIKTHLLIHELKTCVTLYGNNHGFSSHSHIYLQYGSTKEDIIMMDHSELFGVINSFNHGKVKIGEWTTVGTDSLIMSVNSIEIGNNCAIAGNVIVVDNNYHPINPHDRLLMSYTSHGSIERSPIYSTNSPIKIGNNVWLGTYVRICKGVTIGDNTIVGANSVVTKNLPANCVAVGNPARIVKENIDKNTISVFPLSE